MNVHFNGVSKFEYTPECIIFDLLDIPLYHGWLIDPQQEEVCLAVNSTSYNQLVEIIIANKTSKDSELVIIFFDIVLKSIQWTRGSMKEWLD